MDKQIKRKKFNISILGETQVGKTSMIKVLKGQGFEDIMLSTIGIDTTSDKQVFEGQEYTFKIFDTAGQERYEGIVSSTTINVSDGFLMVFSVDSLKTFEKINHWLEFIEEHTDIKEKPIILAGNKIDIENREVSNEEGIKLAKEKGMKYFECSAKTGFGIKDAFHQLYKDIYDIYSSKDKLKQNNTLEEKDNIVIKKEDVKVVKEKRRLWC